MTREKAKVLLPAEIINLKMGQFDPATAGCKCLSFSNQHIFKLSHSLAATTTQKKEIKTIINILNKETLSVSIALPN
jgi:hypothetical protein